MGQMEEVVGDEEKQGPVLMSYVMMRYLNLTQHAIERYQGLLTRKYPI